MGKERSYSDYMKMVGLEPNTKVVTPNQWCHNGVWPQEALPYKIDKSKK
jgi:hypothetical protein